MLSDIGAVGLPVLTPSVAMIGGITWLHLASEKKLIAGLYNPGWIVVGDCNLNDFNMMLDKLTLARAILV
jgi:transcription elongation factor GreA-like protein